MQENPVSLMPEQKNRMKLVAGPIVRNISDDYEVIPLFLGGMLAGELNDSLWAGDVRNPEEAKANAREFAEALCKAYNTSLKQES